MNSKMNGNREKQGQGNENSEKVSVQMENLK